MSILFLSVYQNLNFPRLFSIYNASFIYMPFSNGKCIFIFFFFGKNGHYYWHYYVWALIVISYTIFCYFPPCQQVHIKAGILSLINFIDRLIGRMMAALKSSNCNPRNPRVDTVRRKCG